MSGWQGATLRFVALFVLTAVLAVGLIVGSVLMLDREARRSRAEDAAQRDLHLIAVKLKGALAHPEAAPLIAGVVRDVDAYAGAATGRQLIFTPRGDPRPPRPARDRVEAVLETPAGVLTLSRQIETNGPLRPAFIRYGGLASLLAVLGAVIAGWLVSRWLNSRAAAMNAVFASTASGIVGHRVVAHGPLEFRTLAGNLNVMLDTMERRAADLRLSSDHLAHDLRTPLTRMATRMSVLSTSPDPAARAAAANAQAEIAGLVATLNAILDLREIESERSLPQGRFRLDVAVREAVDLYQAEAEDLHRVDLILDLDPVEMTGSASLVVRAVANLIDNALHAAPPDTAVTIRTTSDAGIASVCVCDLGAGPPDTALQALRGGATIRSGWNGHGLGLRIVAAIARRHGGAVFMERHGGVTSARLEMRLQS